MLARARHYARIPLTAIAIVAVLAFASFTSIRPSSAAYDIRLASTAPAAPALSQHALDVRPCDDAYVTGDLVGDASPATVYATLCNSGVAR
jgi:hypothetical protein